MYMLYVNYICVIDLSLLCFYYIFGVLMTAQEMSTGKVFIFNRNTKSYLKVTGTSGSYHVEVHHLRHGTVSA